VVACAGFVVAAQPRADSVGKGERLGDNLGELRAGIGTDPGAVPGSAEPRSTNASARA
jgi:hypothetical protein